MFPEGGETVGIPTYEKCGAQRIVGGRYGAQMGDAPLATFARGDRFGFEFECVQAGVGAGEQTCGQFDADGDGDEEIGEEERENCARNFYDSPGAAPTYFFFVIKD